MLKALRSLSYLSTSPTCSTLRLAPRNLGTVNIKLIAPKFPPFQTYRSTSVARLIPLKALITFWNFKAHAFLPLLAWTSTYLADLCGLSVCFYSDLRLVLAC